MRAGVLAAGVLAVIGAAQASAQVYYVDRDGRPSEFTAPEIPPTAMPSAARSATDLVQLFRAACLEPGFDLGRTEAAVAAVGQQGKRESIKIPFAPPEYDPRIEVWNLGDSQIQLVAQRIGPPKGNRFRIDGPQCSLISGFRPSIQFADLKASLIAAFGEPTNAADAVKDGKPNKRYLPRWQVDVVGKPAILTGYVFDPSRGGAGRTQLTVIGQE